MITGQSPIIFAGGAAAGAQGVAHGPGFLANGHIDVRIPDTMFP
jgi:hypothetical protein